PRGRPPALPRTLQGHAEDRRRERRPDGGRGVPHGPSSDQPGGGGRLPRRAAFRGRRRVRQARARGGARRGGGDRLLSGQDRELQDPPPRDLRRRVPDDGLGQDPEGEAARGGARAAHPRVGHPSGVTISLAARICCFACSPVSCLPDWATASLLLDSVNQRLPSAPTVIPIGPLPGVATAISVLSPVAVIRPTLLPQDSVNQRLPSGPAVMPSGLLLPLGGQLRLGGRGNSVITP